MTQTSEQEQLPDQTRTHDAVDVWVEAPDVVGGVAVGEDGGSCGAQTFLIPHVGPPRPTAVRGGQVQRRAALQRHKENRWLDF